MPLLSLYHPSPPPSEDLDDSRMTMQRRAHALSLSLVLTHLVRPSTRHSDSTSPSPRPRLILIHLVCPPTRDNDASPLSRPHHLVCPSTCDDDSTSPSCRPHPPRPSLHTDTWHMRMASAVASSASPPPSLTVAIARRLIPTCTRR